MVLDVNLGELAESVGEFTAVGELAGEPEHGVENPTARGAPSSS